VPTKIATWTAIAKGESDPGTCLELKTCSRITVYWTSPGKSFPIS